MFRTTRPTFDLIMKDIRTIYRLLTQVAALVVILLALSSANGQKRSVEIAADESILRGRGENTDRAAAAMRLGFSGNSKAVNLLNDLCSDADPRDGQKMSTAVRSAASSTASAEERDSNSSSFSDDLASYNFRSFL